MILTEPTLGQLLASRPASPFLDEYSLTDCSKQPCKVVDRKLRVGQVLAQCHIACDSWTPN